MNAILLTIYYGFLLVAMWAVIAGCQRSLREHVRPVDPDLRIPNDLISDEEYLERKLL